MQHHQYKTSLDRWQAVCSPLHSRAWAPENSKVLIFFPSSFFCHVSKREEPGTLGNELFSFVYYVLNFLCCYLFFRLVICLKKYLAGLSACGYLFGFFIFIFSFLFFVVACFYIFLTNEECSFLQFLFHEFDLYILIHTY